MYESLRFQFDPDIFEGADTKRKDEKVAENDKWRISDDLDAPDVLETNMQTRWIFWREEDSDEKEGGQEEKLECAQAKHLGLWTQNSIEWIAKFRKIRKRRKTAQCGLSFWEETEERDQ